VFVAGIVAGYLADTDRRRAGLLAGLVGSLPVLWPMLDLLAFVPGLSSPLWFRAIAVVFAIGLFAMLVLFGVVVGVLGAKVGAWLAERTGRSRPPAAGT
jgi:MFS family permease